MKKYIIIIVIIFFLFLSKKLYSVEICDRHSPFGTDEKKNRLYVNGKKGDDYGINTFWGKPSKNDTVNQKLDKIQWLSHSYKNDVVWRRSLVCALVLSIPLAITLDLDYKGLLTITPCVYISIYMSFNYYNHHYLWRRSKFIDIHIRKIKRSLKLPLYNKISENPNI